MTYADFLPLANHLWQSAVFAGAIWALTLALRKNRAAVRYWLWLAASVKFFVPFSLLVRATSHLGWHTIVLTDTAQWSSVAEQISQPFTTSAALTVVRTQEVASATSNPIPAVLFGIWVCGVIVGIIFWFRCCCQVRTALRAATPLDLALPIRVVCSSTRLEPGVFGIRAPVLLLPQGILERLTPAQLGAILQHEICHVRRCDNLTAAIHMLVEVAFWFCPPVWWIRTHLIEERENACDEEVLRAGTDASVYAEGILNVCKLYVQSPLVCLSGITGSDLKRRIEKILWAGKVSDLNLCQKLLLVAAGMLTLTVPVVIGLMNTPLLLSQTTPADRPSFEVASVKLFQDSGVGDRNAHSTYGPQGVDIGARPLRFLIGEAYGMPLTQIKDDQFRSLTLGQGYNIVAKAGHPVSRAELQLMLQSLLEDRFKLKFHRESITQSVYKLVVAKAGSKLELSEEGGDLVMRPSADGFVYRNAEVHRLAGFLSSRLDRIVVDDTGLKGLYNFVVKVPEDLRGQSMKSESSLDSPSAAVFTEVLKPLGLQLVTGKAPVEVFVVDHVERPSEN
jgi:uncharacterized protein (TIGR03435 family)